MASTFFFIISGLLIFALSSKINAAPIDENNSIVDDKPGGDKIPESGGDFNVLIDQRQNGTENYRITVDGVVIAITSLESLLSAALNDFDTLGIDDDFEFETVKPAPQNSTQNEPSATTDAAPAAVVSTSQTTMAKNKRRFGVSGLMRTVFKRKPNSSI